MNIKEAVVLAGGLGTRLRSVVNDMPKCMAIVNGKPFIYYVVKNLQDQGVNRFIFSLGYKHEVLEDYLKDFLKNFSVDFIIENEPLGTGGAIKKAYNYTTQKNVIICNGDTLFKIDLKKLFKLHEEKNSECTLSLKPMYKFDRYGVVKLSSTKKIISFQEKKYYVDGLINGGFWLLNMKKFISKSLPEKFSFEKDYLEKFYLNGDMFGIICEDYFIDIGIPIDFERANKEIANF